MAITTERATRIKHDAAPVSVMFGLLPPDTVDIIAHSFQSFSADDVCVENFADYPDMVMLPFISRSFGDAASTHQVENHPLYAFSQQVKEARRVEMGKGVPPEAIAHTCAEAVIRSFLPAASIRPNAKVEFYDHHLCHAMSTYYPSAFYGKPALVLTLDGWGDGYSSKAYIFRGDFYQEIGASRVEGYNYGESKRALSLGVLYQIFTVAAGFGETGDEGKVEALAAFGQPIPFVYNHLMRACTIANNAIHIAPWLAQLYYRKEFLAFIVEKHGRNDFCATIQKFLEDIVVQYINSLSVPDDIDCLCLAGGVTANIIMNLAIYERTRFKKIHITPYMGDEGTACGAAILAARLHGEDVSWISQRPMPYYGPSYTREEVMSALQRRKTDIQWTDLGEGWQPSAADDIVSGRIIALFQGRMEFGPRALGNRSILANPTDPSFRERINVSIKRRPPWQPFCPSILESERERLFENSFSHKHMAIAFRVKPDFRSVIPSAVHIDGTARPQFVSPGDNPAYHRLLEEVKNRTGFGVVINTSFNLHGRAIVMTPDHAIDDFLDCNLDALYIEGVKVVRA